MALTRPILSSKSAFDATQAETFIFTVTGSSAQITANKLVIRDQSTNAIVYQEKQETFKYQHIVNAGNLTNGTYYNAVIYTYDASGNESPASIPIQFWCYSTPIAQITNIPATGDIDNASFTFSFTYQQAEGEKLNIYVFNLYNATRQLISTSGELYATNGEPPFTGTYTFAGFENNGTYFVEVTGRAIQGSTFTSALYRFNVRYSYPDIFTLIDLKNNCDKGYISVISNITIVEGTSNPIPPIFIDGKEVDLRKTGDWVKWNEGVHITGDYLARIWVRDPNPGTTIAKFSNTSNQRVEITYMEGWKDETEQDKKAYFEAYVTQNSGVTYYIYSNFMEILPDTEYYNVWFTNKNNIYELKIQQA